VNWFIVLYIKILFMIRRKTLSSTAAFLYCFRSFHSGSFSAITAMQNILNWDFFVIDFPALLNLQIGWQISMLIGDHMLWMIFSGLIKHSHKSVVNIISEQLYCMWILRTDHKVNSKCIFVFDDARAIRWPTYTLTCNWNFICNLPFGTLLNHELMRYIREKIMLTLCMTYCFTAVRTTHIDSVGASNFGDGVSVLVNGAMLKID
jgi:hypothetical protein